MQESVFTKIIKNEIPAHKVYEDKSTIVIVPLHPIAVAHVLVIPKTQVNEFYELNDSEYLALMETVKKVALRMKKIYKTIRVGMQVVGLDVPHCHIHVIAFNTIEEFRENPDETLPIDSHRLELIASKLAF